MQAKLEGYNFKEKYLLLLFLLLFRNISNDNNVITITINERLGKNIINTDYFDNISEILVNGKTGNTNNYKNLLIPEINNVTIKFNEYLNNCTAMFYGLDNILFIDTSNFYSFDVEIMRNMFSNCFSLKSIDLSNLDTSSVIDMSGMFSGCNSLTSLDLSNFDTSSVIDMSRMFNLLFSLTSLDLGNLDTSSVIYMSGIFSVCASLISLDLSNFDTSSVKYMDDMFFECSSLKSINFGNFQTSSVIDMSSMFSVCSSLISLDLSNFDTTSVTDMKYMFYFCHSLSILKIDNFNVSSVTSVESMFNGCDSLLSLNLSNFNINTNKYSNMFYNCSKNLEYCIDDKKNYIFLDLLSDYENNCADICVNWNSKKFIVEENICTDDCISYSPSYIYEYNGICYKKAPLIDTTYITDFTISTIITIPNTSNVNISSSAKKNSFGIIIGIIVGAIALIAGIIITIFCCKKKSIGITIHFIQIEENGNNISKPIIYISAEKKINDLIDIYYKNIGNEKGKTKMFLYNEDNIASKKFKNKKLKNYFNIDSNKQVPYNYSSESKLNMDVNYLETGLNLENNLDAHKNQNIKNTYFGIFVIEKGNIIILFNEINNGSITKMSISPFKTVNDLIKLYYKKKGIENENKIIFLYNEMNIAEEEHKNNVIKNYIKNNNYYLKITVLEKGNIKINFYEKFNPLFERYISLEKTMSDIINIYYKERKVKNDNNTLFLCNEENISSDTNKNKSIKEFTDSNPNKYALKILIFEKGTIKIQFKEVGEIPFEIYKSPEEKVKDLIKLFMKHRGIKKCEQKCFLFKGNILNPKDNNNIGKYISKNECSLTILVNNLDNNSSNK